MTGAHRLHLLKHGGAIRALAFSSDDRYLATAGADQQASIWDVTSGALLDILEHHRPIDIITFSPDGTFVAFADDDHTAMVWQWEPKRSQRLRRKQNSASNRQCSHRGIIRALAFSPDGRSLLTASDDSTAKVWDLSNENEIQEIKRFEHQGPIKAACFHAEGQLIVTASEDHTARVWEISSGQAIH